MSPWYVKPILLTPHPPFDSGSPGMSRTKCARLWRSYLYLKWMHRSKQVIVGHNIADLYSSHFVGLPRCLNLAPFLLSCPLICACNTCMRIHMPWRLLPHPLRKAFSILYCAHVQACMHARMSCAWPQISELSKGFRTGIRWSSSEETGLQLVQVCMNKCICGHAVDDCWFVVIWMDGYTSQIYIELRALEKSLKKKKRDAEAETAQEG